MRRIPILAYHRVYPDDDQATPEVCPDLFCGHVTLSVFRGQMAALAQRGFSTVHHGRIADWLYGRADLPQGPLIALGFDDNRLNVLENAEPVMAEHGFTGTVWTVSRLADGNLPYFQTYPWMNWEHLGTLMGKGWEIGAHTASHYMGPPLAKGTFGPEGGRRYLDELIECNDAIERHLGVRPKHFAYPGGEWNDETESLVVRHYDTARHWICDDRPYRPNNFETNPYRLRAINVSMHMNEQRFEEILDGAS
jgi:peptidoglycan/xylan/chitin deacetylase (PgdA/CDA1 family)